MKKLQIHTFLHCVGIILLLNAVMCFAQPQRSQNTTQQPAPIPYQQQNLVSKRVKSEEKIPNSFAIAFYEPTYILPFYYTASPYNSVYQGNTPANESINSTEIKYQLSFKVPLWQHMLRTPAALMLAYTQLSYWQAYNNRAFFRETDYQPEVFIANKVNILFAKYWQLNFINVGLIHQSNGQGGTLERSWNRAYFSATASTEKWLVTVKPWLIFHDNTYQRQNPDMEKYLGYGEIIIAYKYYNQVFSFETQNLLESGGKRSGNILSWSFPLTSYIKGYVQVFSGYGQSLIEYNHRTNSFGLGIALSNWT